jgi:hypothetical protein
MANEQNLKPFSQRTESEQRRIRVMGGKASGKARRDKKTAYEIAKMFFEEKVDVQGKKIDRKQLMILNALRRINNSIMKSNNNALSNEELKSMDYFLQMIGEAPIPKTQQEVTVSAPVQIIDDVDEDTKPEVTD